MTNDQSMGPRATISQIAACYLQNDIHTASKSVLNINNLPPPGTSTTDSTNISFMSHSRKEKLGKHYIRRTSDSGTIKSSTNSSILIITYTTGESGNNYCLYVVTSRSSKRKLCALFLPLPKAWPNTLVDMLQIAEQLTQRWDITTTEDQHRTVY